MLLEKGLITSLYLLYVGFATADRLLKREEWKCMYDGSKGIRENSNLEGKKWGEQKVVTEYANGIYSWEGGLEAFQHNEESKCLTRRKLTTPPTGALDEVFAGPCPGTGDGTRRQKGIYRLDFTKHADVFDRRWFIKGEVKLTEGAQPVFEGYIRSYFTHPETDYMRYCLAALSEEALSPKVRKVDFWNHQSNQMQLDSAYGTVYLAICDPDDPAQQWQIGLGDSQYAGDPPRWTWIRPKVWGFDFCNQPSGWEPFVSYRRTLAIPHGIEPVNAQMAINIGCSTTLWKPQPNFITLNADRSVSLNVIEKSFDPTKATFEDLAQNMWKDEDLEPCKECVPI